jgi:hypothetical protein
MFYVFETLDGSIVGIALFAYKKGKNFFVVLNATWSYRVCIWSGKGSSVEKVNM